MELNRIIKDCISGKRQAQFLLYKEFYSYGMSISARYAKDQDEAKSILNEGFLKVFGKLKQYDNTKAFKPWLRQILIHTAVDHIRREKKFSRHEDIDDLNDAIGFDNTIIENLGYDDLLQAVRILPDKYRAVFNLYAIDGFKHHEIAERLGISEGTSKSNYARAKKKLQDLLKNYKR